MEEILFLQAQAAGVFVHDEIIKGVAHIVRATRNHPDIALGASTRSGIAFLKCLRAWALIRNRQFVIEDDIADITHAVLDHRLIYRNKEGKAKALANIVRQEMERLAKLKLY